MKAAVIVPEPTRANIREVIAALAELGFSESVVRETILPYTAQDKERPSKEWKTGDGWVTVRYFGLSRFGVEHYSGNSQRNRVSTPHPRRYSHPIPEALTPRKGNPMAATATAKRGGRRQAAPAPAPEPEANGFDIQMYLDKDYSATMNDYLDWAEQELGDLSKISADRLFVLGTQLYPHFQKSDLNIERREARRAARSAPAEPEPAAAAPARGRRGSRSAPATEPAEPAPARGRRGGRGRGAAASTENAAEAPY